MSYGLVQNICSNVISSNHSETALTTISIFVCDLLLLTIMMIGLLRGKERRAFGIWRVLWHQVGYTGYELPGNALNACSTGREFCGCVSSSLQRHLQ